MRRSIQTCMHTQTQKDTQTQTHKHARVTEPEKGRKKEVQPAPSGAPTYFPSCSNDWMLSNVIMEVGAFGTMKMGGPAGYARSTS